MLEMPEAAKNKTYQVLIVGAGPTGLLLGILLKKYNISCLIIDKLSSIATTARAVMLHSGSLEIFDSIGILDKVIGKSIESKYISFYFNNYRKAIIDFSKIDSSHPFYLLIKQPDIERILLEKYLSLNGEISRGVNLYAIKYNDEYILSDANRLEESVLFESEYLVGCDGASSKVRSLAGIEMVGETLDFNYILAEGYTQETFSMHESSMYISDKGLLSVIPLPDGTMRIAGPCNFESLRTIDGVDELKSYYESALAKLNMQKNMRFIKYTQISKYTVHQKIAGSFRKGNIFLAGDAAHLHAPAGGQAMNTGFQDVWNLAWKLSFVISGKEDKNMLDTYEKERMPIANDVIQTANFFDFISKIRASETLNEMQDLDEICKSLARKISQNYMDYKTGSLNGKKSHYQIMTKFPMLKTEHQEFDSCSYIFVCRPDCRSLLPENMKWKTVFSDISTDNVDLKKSIGLLIRPDGYIIENFSLESIG